MKRINAYKKMYDVTPETDLRQLKKTYRNLVKEWHPDKFQDGDEKAAEAEIKSQEVIDAYHFLVSIAPETIEASLDEYNALINDVGIADFQHKKQVMEITFKDGTIYEYFGVPEKIVQKMVNSDKQTRFAKRNIFNSYIYRRSQKANKVEA